MTAAVYDLDNLTLTSDQQSALESFYSFLISPVENVFVLRGYSGCGKSTLVRKLLDMLPDYMRTARLIDPNQKEYEPVLTATTNKAAENLAHITGDQVRTIHSFLNLRVSTDFKTNITTLVPRSSDAQEGFLLFIDEASYIDAQLLGYIFKLTRNCKIVFIGDPAQLTPVKASTTPVFEGKFCGAELTQVVRQAEGHPIIDLSTKFRHTVESGDFFSFKPDGHHVVHLDRSDFNTMIEREFARADWRFRDSKILAWTNKCVISFNHMVRNLAKGDPHFAVGDYAVCNSFIQLGKATLKTDQMVQITCIEADSESHDVLGNYITVDNHFRAFQPKSLEAAKARAKQARRDDDVHTAGVIENYWIDLRAAYACTINKSQGSTFDMVFIDLDDISRCNLGDQIARMLYVAVSRARHHVYLTGDLA